MRGETAPPPENAAKPPLLGELWRFVFGQRGGYGFFRVLGRLMCAPVKTTVELASDPAYRSHWSFLGKGTAAWLLLFKAAEWAAPPEGGEADVSQAMQLSLYASFFMCFAVSYFLFRQIAPEPRSAGAYLKFSCLAAGFAEILGGAVMLPFTAAIAIPAVLGYARISIALPAEVQTGLAALFESFLLLMWIGFLGAALYLVLAQRRFWGISFLRSLQGCVVALFGSSVLLFVVQMAVFWLFGARGS